MDIQVLYYVAIINYTFLFLLLVKQNFRSFFYYIIQIFLAACFSIAIVQYNLHNSIVLGINIALFVYLVIIPPKLSQWIADYSAKNVTRAFLYAKIRYFITFADIYKQEYQLFQFLVLLEQQQYQTILDSHNDLRNKVPRLYHHLIDSVVIRAYCALGEWEKACYYFTTHIHLLRRGGMPKALSEIVEAYCEQQQYLSALEIWKHLENHPEKKIFWDTLQRTRACVVAYSGDYRKLENICKGLPEHEERYWYGVAFLHCGRYNDAIAILEGIDTNQVTPGRAKSILHKIRQCQQQADVAVMELDITYTFQDIFEQQPSSSKSKQPEKKPIAAIVLIALNLIAYFLMETFGDSMSRLTLLNAGGNVYDFVLYGNEYWRLLTSMFLQAGVIHLALNTFALYSFGEPIENHYGWHRFLFIYLISGLCSSLCSLHWNSHMPFMLSVGASGAVCGLIGSSAWFFVFQKKFSKQIRDHYIFYFTFIVVALIAFSIFIPYIDNAAHFGGLIVGFLVTAGIDKWKTVSLNKKLVLQKIYVIIYLALILSVVLSAFSFAKNIYRGGYPRVVPTTKNFVLQLDKDQVESQIPVTWYKEKNFFYDVYVTDEHGRIKIYLKISSFQEENKDWSAIQDLWLENFIKRNSDIENVSSVKVLEPMLMGKNSFVSLKINYQEKKSKINNIEEIYFLRRDNTVFEFRFGCELGLRNDYENIILQILSHIEITSVP